MKHKYLTEFNVFFVVLIFTLIALSAPHVMRLNKGSLLIGDEPYYNERIASEVQSGEVLKYDRFVYSNPPRTFNLYPFMLAKLSRFFSLDFASKLIPFLFGLFSLIFFYLILTDLKLDLEYKLATSLILISTPAFIYTFTVSGAMAAAVFLDLCGFYLFLRKSPLYFILAVPVFIAAMFFGFLNAVITIILLAAFILVRPKKQDYIKPLALLIALTALLTMLYLPVYLKYGLPQKPEFIQISAIKTLVSDFGSNGFSLFALLLAFAGIVITWKNKYKFVFGYLVILALLLLLYFSDVSIYLSFIISILAGSAFMALFRMKWEVEQIKTLTIFILILGLFFSSLSYIDRLSSFQPDKDTINSLKWLNRVSKPEEVVFSHHSNGFWIQAIAERPVVMDKHFSYVDADQLYADSRSIFTGRNLNATKSLLDKYDITYIFISKNMKSGLVWTKEDQGLLFLFRDKETFKRIYSRNGTEIWRYLQTNTAVQDTSLDNRNI